MELEHKDLITFYEVGAKQGYGNTKEIIDQAVVECTFVQNTGFLHSASQENIDADAIAYVNHKNPFVIAKANRLEGLYVVSNQYGDTNARSWFKVTDVTVNRDHLLSNQIDNIECRLKKTDALSLVS